MSLPADPLCRDANARIIDDLVTTLSDTGAIYSIWKGESRTKARLSIEAQLGLVIISYLPPEHKKMVFLARDGLDWVDLDTFGVYHVTTWDLYYQVFERMQRRQFEEDDFVGSFLSQIETYPCVYGAVANERYLCWCLEFASGNVDVAWYVVDLLDGWAVKRIQVAQPERLLSVVVRKSFFLSINKIFSVVVDCDGQQVMIAAIDLMSGSRRDLGALDFQSPPIEGASTTSTDADPIAPTTNLSSPHLLVAPVCMTNDRVWLVLYHHDPCTLEHEFKGNVIYDCKAEKAVSSINNSQLVAENVVPTKTSFFVDEWGFFILDSFCRVTWVKLDGGVVSLECAQVGLGLVKEKKYAHIEKVGVFSGEIYLVVTKKASMSDLGGRVMYLCAKCDVFEFVSNCRRACENSSTFEWPTLHKQASAPFAGSFCLC